MDLQGNKTDLRGEIIMITIAKSSDTEREVLFGNTANRAGISNPAIVEKDF